MEGMLFYLIAVITVISALAVVTAKNPIYSACFLIVTFFSLAVIYVLLYSQFIAAVQILVYAGGMIVLILFAIFTINLDTYEFEIKWHLQTPVAYLVCTVLLFEIFYIVKNTLFQKKGAIETLSQAGNSETIGNLLFSKFVLPFEIASVLLLAAMIGAIVMARKNN